MSGQTSGSSFRPEAVTRRTFLKSVGSGLLISVCNPLVAQPSGSLSARLFLNEDGTITALSGKVEEGQGARAELTQAAAEELRVSVAQIQLTMADTDLVPDDGITAGSRTTPRNVPEMRRAAATARELLTELAARRWRQNPSQLEVSEGVILGQGKRMTYADLASIRNAARVFSGQIRPDVVLTEVRDWKTLGESVQRPNSRDLVTGRHRFPSDISRPGMLYGRILRPPSFESRLDALDLDAVKTMGDVSVLRDGQFVGVAAETSYRAGQALDRLAGSAKWAKPRQPVTSEMVHAHLSDRAQRSEARVSSSGSLDRGFELASEVRDERYTLAYIQHTPMEPRAAVAEWDEDRLTVWIGCDNPFRARATLAEEFGIPENQVRVIVPDMGGGFGGKHTAEAGLEAARLARHSRRPVSVRWTREEEFTWAYYRPAAVIDCRGGLDADGTLLAWDFTNINAGGAAIETPYDIPNVRVASVRSDSPLRQGAYRCLGATGNNFARESFMDELAAVKRTDPLDFRLAHLKNSRLRRVLEEAARRFGWSRRLKKVTTDLGIGVACGTEKNSFVAACAEVAIDRRRGTIKVQEICEVFECGPVLNPENLESQVEGCILMGLGGALMEEIRFKDGKIENPRFSQYRVPRFSDVPKISVHLIDNPEIAPAGGGETPIIAVAPAVGNAVFAATGVRLRSMPMRGELQKT